MHAFYCMLVHVCKPDTNIETAVLAPFKSCQVKLVLVGLGWHEWADQNMRSKHTSAPKVVKRTHVYTVRSHEKQFSGECDCKLIGASTIICGVRYSKFLKA